MLYSYRVGTFPIIFLKAAQSQLYKLERGVCCCLQFHLVVQYYLKLLPLTCAHACDEITETFVEIVVLWFFVVLFSLTRVFQTIIVHSSPSTALLFVVILYYSDRPLCLQWRWRGNAKEYGEERKKLINKYLLLPVVFPSPP